MFETRTVPEKSRSGTVACKFKHISPPLFRLPDSDHVKLVTQHVHSLLNAAELVICTTTTIQCEAVLMEKPLLLLSESCLSPSQGAYQANQFASLSQCLETALRRENWPERMQKLNDYICFMADHFLVAMSEDMPVRRDVSSLASFMARFNRPVSMAVLETGEMSFRQHWQRQS